MTDRTQNLPTVPTMFLFIFWFRTNLRSHVAFGCHLSLFPFNVEQFPSLFCIFLDLGSVQISHCFFFPPMFPHAWTQATHFYRKPTEMRLESSLCISLGYHSVNLFMTVMDPQPYIWSRWYLPGLPTVNSPFAFMCWEVFCGRYSKATLISYSSWNIHSALGSVAACINNLCDLCQMVMTDFHYSFLLHLFVDLL